MDNSVVISAGKKLNITKSVAHEDLDGYPKVIFLAEGVAVFNERIELLPLISDFLTDYRRNYSDQSVKTYANNLRYLVKYLTTYDDNHVGSKRDDCLMTVHETEIQKYFDYCRNNKNHNDVEKPSISGKTLSNRDATYNRFFSEFLCNPPAGYKLMREDNPYGNGSLVVAAKESLIKPALFNDIEALLLVANNEREKCLIQFMYDSGVRRGEVESILQNSILQLSRESRKSIIVDYSTIQISSDYVAMEIKGNKGRGREAKFRNTVVSKETINRVQKYHSTLEYKKQKRKWGNTPIPAFLNQNGNPYTEKSVSKLIKRLSVRALKFGLINTMLSPHKIRHGFGAMLLNSEDLGKTQLDRLLLLQQCLGHQSLTTTEGYTKIPIGVWDKLVDRNGIALKKYQLMRKLKNRTRLGGDK
ncbi:tyrosine-type recombinase/integrase [Aliivibrio finisterrensis]|uniref:Tyrosine-type recombinase/integrase n=1 Tax=Aliivibrio finisterrensis TaxID=511998 RepID=A0A6N6RRL3_9GAMM|nr:tyrosine-type recombinase/integrase [Aliivibrio finisterrensis]KAB2824218.1 tyrosine-type recombinase/integrase [Aliivibrio finisterrensis]